MFGREKVLFTNSGKSEFLQIHQLNILLRRLLVRVELSASISSVVTVFKRASAFLLNVVMLLVRSVYEGVCFVLGLLMMPQGFTLGLMLFDVFTGRGRHVRCFQQASRLCQNERNV